MTSEYRGHRLPTVRALEDAIELARQIESGKSLEEALTAYQEARSLEVLRLQSAARNSTEWFENVERYAQDQAIPFSNFASLCRRPEIQALIQGEIDKVNKLFARVEQVKKFRLLEQKLTAEDEELTPTLKLKRKLVNQKYKDLIDSMYKGE